MSGLALIAVTAPLALAALLAIAGLRGAIARVAPLAAVPALVVAALAPPVLDVPWLLLGVRLGVEDALARGFLAFTGLLWLVAAWFARAYLGTQPHRARFWAFFLIAMAGNLALVLARDAATFYFGFATMSVASYGLVIHDGTAAARRAGRVYLAMVLLGDVLILAAIAMIAADGANPALAEVPAAVARAPRRGLIAALFVAGFGVKAGGVIPLHVWLPLAHPVAPTPASAVLSGAMIEAGLYGWLVFLPLGAAAMPGLGAALVALGALAALFGAAVGVTQRDAKTVLAYSSVSQAGLATIAIGVAAAVPAAAAPARAAVLVFAAHHGIAKAALFLGTAVAAPARGPVARALVAVGLMVPALAIAGAPLSSGAAAKRALKDVTALAPRGALLAALLSIAAIGSTLLMARFLQLARPRPGRPRPLPAGLWVPWAALLVAGAAWFAARAELAALARPGAAWTAAWPILAGAALAIAAMVLARRGVRAPEVPPGDVVVVFEAALRRALARARGSRARARRAAGRAGGRLRDRLDRADLRARWRRLERVELLLGEPRVVGVLVAALLVALLGALWRL